jgi:hypothetical protein
MASFPVPICRWSFRAGVDAADLVPAALCLRRRSSLGRRAGSVGSARWACSALDQGGLVDVLRRLVAERGAAGRGGRHAIAAPSDAGSLRGRTHRGGWPATLVHALTISGPPPAVDAASTVRAKDLLYRTVLASGVSFTRRCCSSTTQFVRGGRRPWRQPCSPIREQPPCCRSRSINCRSRFGRAPVLEALEPREALAGRR